MSDPTYSATDQQTDEPVVDGDGQEVEPTSPQAPVAETKYPTVDEIVNALLPQVDRRIQSRMAQGANQIGAKVQQEIQKGFEALQITAKTAGLDENQIRNAQDRIVREAYARANNVEEQTPQPEFDNQPQLHPLVYSAIQMMNERGTIVEEGDPEFDKYIKPYLGPGVNSTILNQTIAAMDAKEIRIKTDKDKAQLRQPGGRGVSSPPNDISKITDSKELYQMGEAQFRKK